jgi:hypothetical protein
MSTILDFFFSGMAANVALVALLVAVAWAVYYHGYNRE